MSGTSKTTENLKVTDGKIERTLGRLGERVVDPNKLYYYRPFKSNRVEINKRKNAEDKEKKNQKQNNEALIEEYKEYFLRSMKGKEERTLEDFAMMEHKANETLKGRLLYSNECTMNEDKKLDFEYTENPNFVNTNRQKNYFLSTKRILSNNVKIKIGDKEKEYTFEGTSKELGHLNEVLTTISKEYNKEDYKSYRETEVDRREDILRSLDSDLVAKAHEKNEAQKDEAAKNIQRVFQGHQARNEAAHLRAIKEHEKARNKNIKEYQDIQDEKERRAREVNRKIRQDENQIIAESNKIQGKWAKKEIEEMAENDTNAPQNQVGVNKEHISPKPSVASPKPGPKPGNKLDASTVEDEAEGYREIVNTTQEERASIEKLAAAKKKEEAAEKAAAVNEEEGPRKDRGSTSLRERVVERQSPMKSAFSNIDEEPDNVSTITNDSRNDSDYVSADENLERAKGGGSSFEIIHLVSNEPENIFKFNFQNLYCLNNMLIKIKDSVGPEFMNVNTKKFEKLVKDIVDKCISKSYAVGVFAPHRDYGNNNNNEEIKNSIINTNAFYYFAFIGKGERIVLGDYNASKRYLVKVLDLSYNVKTSSGGKTMKKRRRSTGGRKHHKGTRRRRRNITRKKRN